MYTGVQFFRGHGVVVRNGYTGNVVVLRVACTK